MKKEFIVNRQGKDFVLYAGLLELAHEAGLRSIRTELIQAPTEDNGRVAICGAVVTLEKDGIERVFTGIGDAAINNVAPAMATCLIRMAETRSKARALRDAVNVGVAAFEESGEDLNGDAPSVRTRSSRQATPARQAAPERNQGAHSPTAPRPDQVRPVLDPSAPITDAQIQAIVSTASRRGIETPSLEGWTQERAGEWIRQHNRAAATN